MGQEIERKFLINKALWQPQNEGTYICQGYLSTDPERTVRVRIYGEEGFLTVKGKNKGIVRQEWESAIPLTEAKEMLSLCLPPLVEKRRYVEVHHGQKWEIDVFAGANAGLLLAEAELPSAEAELILPPWIDREVSGDSRYYNSYLSRHPYSSWEKGPDASDK